MKHILLIFALFLLLGTMSYAQTYYVKPENGIEQPIINKLIDLKQNVTMKRENSDYTIDCSNIILIRSLKAKGFVIITDSKTGNVLAKSDEITGAVSDWGKMAGKDARYKATEKFSDKYLSEMILKLKK